MVVTALTPAENDTAVTAFEELGICRQLAEAAAGLGWKTPSSIQAQAIPHLLQGIANRSGQVLHLQFAGCKLDADCSVPDCCRQGYHWPSTNWLRQNRRLCPPHIRGKLQMLSWHPDCGAMMCTAVLAMLPAHVVMLCLKLWPKANCLFDVGTVENAAGTVCNGLVTNKRACHSNC